MGRRYGNNVTLWEKHNCYETFWELLESGTKLSVDSTWNFHIINQILWPFTWNPSKTCHCIQEEAWALSCLSISVWSGLLVVHVQPLPLNNCVLAIGSCPRFLTRAQFLASNPIMVHVFPYASIFPSGLSQISSILRSILWLHLSIFFNSLSLLISFIVHGIACHCLFTWNPFSMVWVSCLIHLCVPGVLTVSCT